MSTSISMTGLDYLRMRWVHVMW